MIGTSATEYAFIRVCIFILHCVAPLSLLYCGIAIAISYPVPRRPTVIELWPVAEALFWTCFFLPYRSCLQNAATHPALRSRKERRKLVNLVKAEVSEPERFIRGWFKGARIDDIGLQNVKEWLTWAFLDRDWVDGKDEDEIEEYALEIEDMLGKDFRAERGAAEPLRLTIDPVNMLHRSLLWYLVSCWCTNIGTSFWLTRSQCVGVVDFIAYLKLQRSGFRFHRLPLFCFWKMFPFRPVSLVTRYRSPSKHLSYWYRPHTSRSRLPVLFVHGIGIGLYPYINFLSEINFSLGEDGEESDDQIGVLAIEVMSISFRITHSALGKEDMCAEIREIVEKHNYDRFVLVSHSYGSVISTFILADQHLRPKVASALLVDPVTFLLHTPDVAYNFTARQPRRANEWQLWYFASRDPGVAHALGRRFFWSQKVMWKGDVEDFVNDGGRLTVSLGGKDLIVNTEAVGRYLTDSGVARAGQTGHVTRASVNLHEDAWKDTEWKGIGLEVLWFRHLDHGQVFDEKATRARLVRVVQSYCKEV